ncbi:MAG: hypothetical protein ACPK85_14145 [Methanosarcina sp.]
MFIKAYCPVCGSEIYHNIRLHALEYLNFEKEETAYRYTIEKVEITDTLTEEKLVRDILSGLQRSIYDGIEIEVLAGILEVKYGVTRVCCDSLIERIQLELDMYSSEKKRLYFAEPEELGSYNKKNEFHIYV